MKAGRATSKAKRTGPNSRSLTIHAVKVNNYNLGYYRPSGLPLVSKMPPVSDLYSEQSTVLSSYADLPVSRTAKVALAMVAAYTQA